MVAPDVKVVPGKLVVSLMEGIQHYNMALQQKFFLDQKYLK